MMDRRYNAMQYPTFSNGTMDMAFLNVRVTPYDDVENRGNISLKGLSDIK